LAFAAFAQDRVVKGRVTDPATGEGLPGVSVFIENTTTGTVTNSDGTFEIRVSKGSVLVFKSVGLLTQRVTIDEQASLNISMAPDIKELGEIVVTGYGEAVIREKLVGAIATVKSDSYKDIPVVSIDQALQGQAPGVQVSLSSGTPGGGIKINIRGNTSINASNRPLFIVDGIQVEDGALTTRSFGNQDDNALSTINPNDIESIEVLKDASAKAIYGTRGANGVVIVTTKRGKKDSPTRFNVDFQRGITDVTKKLDLLNSTELLTLQREAVINAGQDPDLLGLIPGVTDAIDTDWLDEVLRQGNYEQYQISAQGGGNKTTYYVSANYRGEEGVQLNNRFDRYTGTFNLNHQATNKLSFGLNVQLAYTTNRRVKSDNFLDGVYSGALRSIPYYAPFDEFGNIIGPNDAGYAGFPNFNPVGQAILPRFLTYTTKILAGLNVEYKIVDNLKFRTQFSVDYNDVDEDQFEPTTTAIGGFLFPNGYGVYSTSNATRVLNASTLTYANTFAEKHNVSALVGAEFQNRRFTQASVEGQDFPNDQLTYITSAATVNAGTSFEVDNGLVSYFFNVKYDFNEKYLFEATARTDASSRFGEDRRYGFFPSVSLGWRISEEAFFDNIEFIDELKLRASYGLTGNERIDNFAFLATWGAASYGARSGVSPSSLDNPELQWERTAELNIGLDVALLKGRVAFSLDYYTNKTTELLFAEQLPLTTGFGSVLGNIGEISNQGIELGLNTVNLDLENGFQWTTNFNISRNVNEVVSLATDEPQFFGYALTPTSTHIIQVGAPLGSFYGLEFLGVDPATGDAIYNDLNGDGTINDQDAKIIGNAQPDFIGGITNRFTFKGFDLSIFFQFSSGNQLINGVKEGLLDGGNTILDNNQLQEALERWQKPGDITDVPRYEAGNVPNSFFSSRFVEDASFLRLKNITLGYSFSDKLLKKTKVIKSAPYFISPAPIS
ncbi:MAG: TonB-dependent receptor, partial [Microscillaceae bacterium]|nr:TonB-dependent receptor [Microscillaceae bacterium]